MPLVLCALAVAAGLVATACDSSSDSASSTTASPAATSPAATATAAPSTAPPTDHLRIATYNASLNRGKAGELLSDVSTPNNAQAKVIAEIVQRNQPDVLLINEFDYYANNAAVTEFAQNYLGVSQRGQQPVSYPYVYAPPVNTGVQTGKDLDHNGTIDGNDAYGFGAFDGQYGFVLFSKYPIQTDKVRTFQHFLWKDMPDNLLPRNYYGANSDLLRLSSKNHADIPITVGDKTIHILASHPTPPSFDGPEDRNGRRNHDEIRLWADYISGGDNASYLVDDKGTRGGLAANSSFVILGDMNADPLDGDSYAGGINQLLDKTDLLSDPKATSAGAPINAKAAGEKHQTDPRYDTADFSDPEPGNLRVDYILPSKDLTPSDAHVFWPAPGQPGADLMDPKVSSDHRLVRVNLALG